MRDIRSELLERLAEIERSFAAAKVEYDCERGEAEARFRARAVDARNAIEKLLEIEFERHGGEMPPAPAQAALGPPPAGVFIAVLRADRSPTERDHHARAAKGGCARHHGDGGLLDLEPAGRSLELDDLRHGGSPDPEHGDDGDMPEFAQPTKWLQ